MCDVCLLIRKNERRDSVVSIFVSEGQRLIMLSPCNVKLSVGSVVKNKQ